MVSQRNTQDSSGVSEHRIEGVRCRHANKTEEEREQRRLEAAAHKRALRQQRRSRNAKQQIQDTQAPVNGNTAEFSADWRTAQNRLFWAVTGKLGGK